MSAAAVDAPTPPVVERRRPRSLSPQVEAQLAKLEELRDRYSLVLLLQAIAESEGRPS